MSKSKHRSHYPATGTFISVPDVFEAAGVGLKNIVKVCFESRLSETDTDKLDTVFAPDVILLDLGAINPAALKTERIVQDCKLISEVAINHQAQIRELATIFQPQTAKTRASLAKADAIVRKLGLTEDDIARSGGGILGILAVAALVAISSCCAHCSNRKPPQTPKENGDGGGEGESGGSEGGSGN